MFTTKNLSVCLTDLGTVFTFLLGKTKDGRRRDRIEGVVCMCVCVAI